MPRSTITGIQMSVSGNEVTISVHGTDYTYPVGDFLALQLTDDDTLRNLRLASQIEPRGVTAESFVELVNARGGVRFRSQINYLDSVTPTPDGAELKISLTRARNGKSSENVTVPVMFFEDESPESDNFIIANVAEFIRRSGATSITPGVIASVRSHVFRY